MGSKRRSGPAGFDSDDFLATPGPDLKRRKRNDDTHFPDVETSETTSDIGLRLVGQLKKSQDKNGRNVAIHFIDLPSRTEYPDYYQRTAMPLSLNMIEQRLQKFEYENLERLESDLKRMVQNAKDYNNSKSSIFEDAERIRKALSNFMPKHNPAYLKEDYRAYPTPIPDEMLEGIRQPSISSQGTGGPDKVKLVLTNTGAKRRQSHATPSTMGTPVADKAEDIKEEQLAFLQELSEQEDAINFEERVPKKDYPDYYKMIKKPTSIADVRIQVEKEALPDWDALAREVRLIWDNAKEYNVEGSDIYQMAEKLEAWSESRLQLSGAQPRRNLKLCLTQPKPKALRLTMASTPSTPNLVGGTIDNESLRRQKQEMGEALSRVNRGGSKSAQMNGSTPAPLSAEPSLRRSISLAEDQADTSMIDVKVNGSSNTPQAPEPAIVSQPPAQSVPQRVPTAVQEVDQQLPNGTPLTNGVTHSTSYTHKGPVNNAFNYLNQSVIPMERRFRDPDRGWDYALLSSVTFMTNPSLANDQRWKLIRHGSPTKTQTSGFIALPPSYRDVRIIPNLSPQIQRRRRQRVVFMHNATVYKESNSIHVPGAFETRLVPGENILVVECLADLRDGERKEYAPQQLQFDFERCTMIIHLSPS